MLVVVQPQVSENRKLPKLLGKRDKFVLLQVSEEGFSLNAKNHNKEGERVDAQRGERYESFKVWRNRDQVVAVKVEVFQRCELAKGVGQRVEHIRRKVHVDERSERSEGGRQRCKLAVLYRTVFGMFALINIFIKKKPPREQIVEIHEFSKGARKVWKRHVRQHKRDHMIVCGIAAGAAITASGRAGASPQRRNFHKRIVFSNIQRTRRPAKQHKKSNGHTRHLRFCWGEGEKICCCDE